MVDWSEFDWMDNGDVAAAAGAQLTAAIAQMANEGRDEDDLINGFLAGRFVFVVRHDGVLLLEAGGVEGREK